MPRVFRHIPYRWEVRRAFVYPPRRWGSSVAWPPKEVSLIVKAWSEGEAVQLCKESVSVHRLKTMVGPWRVTKLNDKPDDPTTSRA